MESGSNVSQPNIGTTDVRSDVKINKGDVKPQASVEKTSDVNLEINPEEKLRTLQGEYGKPALNIAKVQEQYGQKHGEQERQKQELHKQTTHGEEKETTHKEPQEHEQQPLEQEQQPFVGRQTFSGVSRVGRGDTRRFGQFGEYGQQQFRSHQQKYWRSRIPQQINQNIITDPTLDYFNSLVESDKYCLLGSTGVKVCRVVLGTMNFGKIDPKFGDRPGQLDEDNAHKILDRYCELGGNCIDTANFFPWFGENSGETERIIGNWLKNQKRENLFVITKARLPSNEKDVNSCGLSKMNLINSVKCSLQRLQTDYIDLLLLNGWDPRVEEYDLVKYLDQLVMSGKVRYIGCCDFKGWQVQKLIDYSKILNANRIVCYEGEYNLLTRGCEAEIRDVCIEERIGFLAYSPLKYGFLTDKFSARSTESIKGSRFEAASGDKVNLAAMAEPFEEIQRDPKYGRILGVCEKIANQKNLSVSQVALLWCLQQKFCTSVVVGCNDIEELEENMQCINGDLELTTDELMELSLASCYDLDYPYSNLAQFVGYKEVYPSFNTSFEQLSMMNSGLITAGHSVTICPATTQYEQEIPISTQVGNIQSVQQFEQPITGPITGRHETLQQQVPTQQVHTQQFPQQVTTEQQQQHEMTEAKHKKSPIEESIKKDETSKHQRV